MSFHERPDAPTLEVRIAQRELMTHNRWNAGYFEERFRRNEKTLRKLGSVRLGDFIPEQLPDGSKGITYGQVGARKPSPRGRVRYLQVINARMAIVPLVRCPSPAAPRKTVLAEVREKWWDADGTEKTTDLLGELETVVGHQVEPCNRLAQ